MPPTPENIEDVSPYSLLHNFSKSRLLRCLLLALLIHAAVIGGLSTKYIYRTWIDPEVASPEPEAVGAAASQDNASDESADSTEEADPATAAKDSLSDDGDDAPQDAPIVNRVTESADPDQIPDDPGGLGLSIDDVKE
jgi:hypothetical protein